MKQKIWILLVALVGLVGCGQETGSPRDTTPVDVTANVTGPDGKPLSKGLVVILQPTGDTLGSRLEATTDGKFTGKAMPGKYVYYVKLAKGDDLPKGIPQKFAEPNEENKVDVSSGTPLTIKIGG